MPASLIQHDEPSVWQFLRDNWLSNHVFKSYDDLVDHCCAAWNRLIEQPKVILGVKFSDGIEVVRSQAQAAAA